MVLRSTRDQISATRWSHGPGCGHPRSVRQTRRAAVWLFATIDRHRTDDHAGRILLPGDDLAEPPKWKSPDPVARPGDSSTLARERGSGRLVAWRGHRRHHHGRLPVLSAAGECPLTGPGDSSHEFAPVSAGVSPSLPAGRDDLRRGLWP